MDFWVGTATQQFRDRLKRFQDMAYGLSVASTSEVIDYPLRCLRLVGYLSTARLACLDIGDDEQARSFGDCVAALWRSNDAACESPVTDDQVIELFAVWLLLLRLGRPGLVGEMATSLVNRLLARRFLRLRLPGLYQRASIQVHDDERPRPTGRLESAGSTIRGRSAESTLGR
jgi:hypothetical protein